MCRYLLVILLIPTAGFCQITGIGIFRLGSTPAETVFKVAEEKHVDVDISKNLRETYGSYPGKDTRHIYQVEKEPNSYLSDPLAATCQT